MKTEKIAAALRCSFQGPGPQLDCATCRYHMEETVDGVDHAGCEFDRIVMDAADRLEELVDRCARYAEEIAVLREKMKPYEETGLTADVCAEYRKFEDEVVASGKTFGRLLELLRADTDGRVTVLPCKVGDTLWVTGRDNVAREMELEAPDIRAGCTDEDNLCMSTCNRKPDGFCAYRLRNDGADVGKTVFLTRKEAEEALEAMRKEETP